MAELMGMNQTDFKLSPRVADILAQGLYAAGVRFAFGMPGGEVITFVDALRRVGITFVLARNETAAAMMAAGTCTDGRTPGLLVTTLGPGLANAVNGIADAAQEHAPLIIVSGVVDRSIRARYTHQILDQAALLYPLVKASFEVEPESVGETVSRALRLALSPQPGPVHLDLSPGVAALPPPAVQKLPASTRRMTLAPQVNDPVLAEVRTRLAAAQRPLIMAGFEAARSFACSTLPRAFQDMVEAQGFPVLTTYKAKGLIDEHHPLSLGAAGLSPKADRLLLGLLQRADLVLAVGYDPIEMRQGWMDCVLADALIEIGQGHDHAMHTAGLHVAEPVDTTLTALLAGLTPKPVWGDDEPAQTRAALRSLFAGPPAADGHFGPHAVFQTLQEVCGTSVLTIDSGAHRILLSQMWQASLPLTVLQSAGWCTMGSALPLAIGHQLTHPNDHVVAVMGDGGFEMTLGELGTLRDQSLKLTMLVLQDESLALIGLKQTQSQLPQTGVAMGATDYASIAHAFGGHGRAVTTTADLQAALQQAKSRDTFTVIACQIAAQDYADAF